MEVLFDPDVQAQLDRLALDVGRGTEELVREVVTEYVHEIADVRETLDRRYDDLKSGRVNPINGQAFFESLRQREDELLKPRTR